MGNAVCILPHLRRGANPVAKNKESLKRDMCRKLLFSLGKNNDDDIIIDQCESVLEQYKNHVAGNGAEVSTKDLAAALESLLKVVQRESK